MRAMTSADVLMSPSATVENLLHTLATRPVESPTGDSLQAAMRDIVHRGLADLPMPGSGQTLSRWRTLAAVAASDLALVKLYEGHTDALAIMVELAFDLPSGEGIWGVWAAEPPYARVEIANRQGDQVQLTGRKAWCSGAAMLDWALVTAWDEQKQPQLVAVKLKQPGVQVVEGGWQAVGMSASASLDVQFEGAQARCVGTAGRYVERPGFWQGGAGIAACWYGAACALAGFLREHCTRPHPDVHAQAHLGAVDAALCAAATSLRATADWIDAHPRQSAEIAVRRLRAQVEATVSEVLMHVGRALGATPFCRNAHFARLAADLPVFVRQSHAERDLAELGRQVAAEGVDGWTL